MNSVIFIIFLSFVYLCFGLLILVSGFGDRLYKRDVNPLWRIPGWIFWPMLIVISIGEGLTLVIINYIEEVRGWYSKHKGRSIDVKKDSSITINITNERVVEKVKEELEKKRLCCY